MKTTKQINDAAAEKLAAFFASNAGTFTAAQAGYLAGAKFDAYTDQALLREVERLEQAGAIELVGYVGGAKAYRAVAPTADGLETLARTIADELGLEAELRAQDPEPIHLEGEDAEDLRRILRALEDELGPKHRNSAGLIFSILADLPADLGVWRRK